MAPHADPPQPFGLSLVPFVLSLAPFVLSLAPFVLSLSKHGWHRLLAVALLFPFALSSIPAYALRAGLEGHEQQVGDALRTPASVRPPVTAAGLEEPMRPGRWCAHGRQYLFRRLTHYILPVLQQRLAGGRSVSLEIRGPAGTHIMVLAQPIFGVIWETIDTLAHTAGVTRLDYAPPDEEWSLTATILQPPERRTTTVVAQFDRLQWSVLQHSLPNPWPTETVPYYLYRLEALYQRPSFPASRRTLAPAAQSLLVADAAVKTLRFRVAWEGGTRDFDARIGDPRNIRPILEQAPFQGHRHRLANEFFRVSDASSPEPTTWIDRGDPTVRVLRLTVSAAGAEESDVEAVSEILGMRYPQVVEAARSALQHPKRVVKDLRWWLAGERRVIIAATLPGFLKQRSKVTIPQVVRAAQAAIKEYDEARVRLDKPGEENYEAVLATFQGRCLRTVLIASYLVQRYRDGGAAGLEEPFPELIGPSDWLAFWFEDLAHDVLIYGNAFDEAVTDRLAQGVLGSDLRGQLERKMTLTRDQVNTLLGLQPDQNVLTTDQQTLLRNADRLLRAISATWAEKQGAALFDHRPTRTLTVDEVVGVLTGPPHHLDVQLPAAEVRRFLAVALRLTGFSPAGLEEPVREFESVDEVIETLRREGAHFAADDPAIAAARTANARVIDFPSAEAPKSRRPQSDGMLIIYTMSDWQEAIAAQTRRWRKVRCADGQVRLYFEVKPSVPARWRNDQVPGRVVGIRSSDAPPLAGMPNLILSGPSEVARLTPGMLYSMTMNPAWNDQAIPVVSVLAYTDAQGRDRFAVFV